MTDGFARDVRAFISEIEREAKKKLEGIGFYVNTWDHVPRNDSLPTQAIYAHNLGPVGLKAAYAEQDWETDVLLQGPNHEGPTTARVIGMPYNMPQKTWEALFSRWGKSCVLRLHSEIYLCRNKLVSWPHIEPDPHYDPEKHLEMFAASNAIRGQEVISVFRQFFR